MKAILFALGSRGDVEPFLAIGEILRRKNWEIICVFPEQFREMVEEEGYEFHGFSKEFLELMLKSESAHVITGGEGNLFKRMSSLYDLAKAGIRINKETMAIQHEVIKKEQPDYILYHPKTVYPPVWGMKHKGRSVLISPLPCISHPVYRHSMIGLKGGGDYGKLLNRLSYFLPNLIRSYVTHRSMKKYYGELKGVKLGTLAILKHEMQKEKSLYAVSPTLFPRPDHWPDAAQVVGYYERKKTNHWSPDQELIDFIAKHQKIVFITFGSISNPKPKEKTAIIIDVLRKHQIPAIINTSWGGLIKPDEYPDHIHFVQNIPYDWVFPQMYAVVHHGGSGTTHTALKHGCASLVVPHFIDQFYWNRVVAKVGAGPKGISIKKLEASRFEILLLDLLNNPTYKERAEWVAIQMAHEVDEERVLQLILQ